MKAVSSGSPLTPKFSVLEKGSFVGSVLALSGADPGHEAVDELVGGVGSPLIACPLGLRCSEVPRSSQGSLQGRRSVNVPE